MPATDMRDADRKDDIVKHLKLLSFLAFGAVQAIPQGARADQDLLIAIDVSGSMTSSFTTPTGSTMTRLEWGKTMAKAWLEEKLNSGDKTRVSVFKFHDLDFEEVVPFFEVDAGGLPLLNLFIDNIDQTFGKTPLAMAMCNSYDELVDLSSLSTEPDGTPIPNLAYDKYLYVATDGLENNSHPSGTSEPESCVGPDSTSGLGYPDYSVGSWQWFVRNKLIMGDPETEPPAGLPEDLGFVLEVDMIFDSFIGGGSPSFLPVLPIQPIPIPSPFQPPRPIPDPPPFAKPVFQTLARSISSTRAAARKDYELFLGLTAETGGKLVKFEPNERGVIDVQTVVKQRKAGLLGDLDASGCVDRLDVKLLKNELGNKASSSPSAKAADLDFDGKVDSLDYLVLLKRFGSGPKCK